MGKRPTNRCEWLETLPRGSVGAELGVSRGRLSKRILQIVRPSRLYLVDAWRQQSKGSFMDRKRTDAEHEKHYRDAMRVISPFRRQTEIRVVRRQTVDAAPMVPDHTLDWLYIDADHTFDGVYGDLTAWWPKVKRGGQVAGHDYLPTYTGQGATLRALDKMKAKDDDGCGVIGAVQRFIGEHGISEVNTTDERCPSFWFVKE